MKAKWTCSRTMAIGSFLLLFLSISSLWSSRQDSTPKLFFPRERGEGLKSFDVDPSFCKVTDISFDSLYERGVWNGGKVRYATVGYFYGNATWPPKHRISLSGKGSELGDATTNSMKFLMEAIGNYSIRSMIDVPCGDANWIFDSWQTDSLPFYLGLDVAKQVVDLNTERFHHHSNKRFRQWDATSCPLPKLVAGNAVVPFDLVHSRDVLQHLPLSDSILFLCNIVTSGARVFITTTFPNGKNDNITRGNFYTNNINEQPFSFPRPKVCVPTHPSIEDDLTCLFELVEDGFKDFVRTKC